jgi:hypothetical protein
MKTKTCLSIAVLVVILVAILWRDVILTRLNMLRYGVVVDWNYGASSTVPSPDISVGIGGKSMKCPYYFGGIERPTLRVFDYARDGTPDLVFGNGRYEIIVAFDPEANDIHKAFRLVKDNTGRGFNEPAAVQSAIDAQISTAK